VEKAGGEKEAIVEVLGQVYLVHEGESFAEKNRALQVTASSAAAQAMQMPSTAQVLPEILRFGAGGAIQAIFAVQVGAFRDRSNAERLKERIESQFGPVIIQDFERGGGLFYRVRVGHESTEDAARTVAQSLRRANLATGTFVVRLN
jgi:cell division protein FtsN